MCSVQCAVCSVQCAVCSVQCALYYLSYRGNSLPVPELGESLSVVECLHEDLAQLLLVLRLLVLLLPVLQQHVHLGPGNHHNVQDKVTAIELAKIWGPELPVPGKYKSPQK